MMSTMRLCQIPGNQIKNGRVALLSKPQPAHIAKYALRSQTRRFSVSAFADNETSKEGASITTIPLKLSVPFQAAFGEHLRVVGNIESLGGWEIDQAAELSWSEGDIWTVTVEVPVDSTVEYKLVYLRPDHAPEWEYSPNRQVVVPSGSPALSLSLNWCNPEPIAAEPLPDFEIPVPTTLDAVTMPFEAAPVPAAIENETVEVPVAVEVETPSFSAAAAATVEETLAGDDEVPTDAISAVEAFSAKFAASEGVTAEEIEEEETAAVAPSDDSFLKGAARTAGYVALGVAGAAVLSAFAIDIADTAILGAAVAAAGGAALSTTSTTSAGKKLEAGEDGEEEEVTADAEPNITGAGQPGVILAAGLMSAFDAGKSMAKALTGEDAVEEESEE